MTWPDGYRSKASKEAGATHFPLCAWVSGPVISILFDAEADSLSSPSLQANLRSGQHAGKYS